MRALVVLLFIIISANGLELEVPIQNNDQSDQFQDNGTFLYFAYGSNLLKSRMHINCLTAKFLGKAELKGWRLDFNITVGAWNGAVATIVPDKNVTIYGAVWRISNSEMAKLDKQEGLDIGMYYAENVTVMLQNGQHVSSAPVTARTYIEYNAPDYVPPEKLPPSRQPSKTYFQVILLGAIECGLPVRHLRYLQRFPNNGIEATRDRLKALKYPFYDNSIRDN